MADDRRAFLTLATTLKGLPKSFSCVVTRYTRGYSVQMDTNTVRKQKNYTPRRVKETQLELTIQCRNVDEYEDIIQRIYFSQKSSLENPANGFVRFSWPFFKLDYIGLLINSPAGANRFEITPSISISFLLLHDTINSITTKYSTLDGSIKDIYSNQLIALHATSGADDILANTPPIGGGGGGRGPIVQ